MTDIVENNTTTPAETITVFHGSSSFFDTPDLDKEETNVHGSGFYTTLNVKEAYNYAYANAGQNAQKDSEKNAIYRMEISKKGMYNGYSLVDADLLKKLKEQAANENNTSMQAHLETISPEKSKYNDLLKVGFETGKTKDDNDFFTRAGINSVMYNGWVIAFNNNAIVNSELAFASVKEGVEIPKELITENTITMTFDEKDGKKVLSEPSKLNHRVQKCIDTIRKESTKLADKLSGIVNKTPKTEFGVISSIALANEIEVALKDRDGEDGFNQTSEFYRNIGDKNLESEMGEFLFDGLRPHIIENAKIQEQKPESEYATMAHAPEIPAVKEEVQQAQPEKTYTSSELYEKNAKVFMAIQQGDLETVKKEFANGGDKALFGYSRNVILEKAVEHNSYERNKGILDFILENEHVKINTENRDRQTAGHIAVLHDDPVALKKLKDAGLDMGIKDYKGRTVADMVAERKGENTRVNETSEQAKSNASSMASLALSKSGKTP